MQLNDYVIISELPEGFFHVIWQKKLKYLPRYSWFLNLSDILTFWGEKSCKSFLSNENKKTCPGYRKTTSFERSKQSHYFWIWNILSTKSFFCQIPICKPVNERPPFFERSKLSKSGCVFITIVPRPSSQCLLKNDY